MKKLKEVVRFVSTIIGGIAALVFLRAPFTDAAGWALMGISVIVGLLCFGAYRWAEPDVDISDIVCPAKKDKFSR